MCMKYLCPMNYRQQARKIIRIYRTANDLSQVEFAVKCGISLRSVAKIEVADSVSDDTLNRALDVVGYKLLVSKTIEKKDS